MAARNRVWTPEKARLRMRATMLVRRLRNHVANAEKYPLTPTQLDAAKFLLSRILPAAQAPRNLNITGQVALTDMLGAAMQPPKTEQATVQ